MEKIKNIIRDNYSDYLKVFIANVFLLISLNNFSIKNLILSAIVDGLFIYYMKYKYQITYAIYAYVSSVIFFSPFLVATNIIIPKYYKIYLNSDIFYFFIQHFILLIIVIASNNIWKEIFSTKDDYYIRDKIKQLYYFAGFAVFGNLVLYNLIQLSSKYN